MFDHSRFWAAFKDAGFLKLATFTGESPALEIDVGFVMPGVLRMDGMTRSTEYEIEYQHADHPTLTEGAAVEIDGESYRVRSVPFVPDQQGQGIDGYFRRAVLTKTS